MITSVNAMEHAHAALGAGVKEMPGSSNQILQKRKLLVPIQNITLMKVKIALDV